MPGPRISLANLRPLRAAQHNQKRVGRGQGSGYGGTSGKGHKGQNARSGGGPHVSFEGGQTPITKRFPKRGFFNFNQKTFAPVNLDRIQHWISQGRLTSSPERPITARDLLLSGCVHDVHDGIKILGDGLQFFNSKIYITPSRASKAAIKAIEEHGGTVVCRYYNTLSLRDCVSGRERREGKEGDKEKRIDAAPTRREDIKWYTSPYNRGYLAPETLKTVAECNMESGIGSQVVNRWKILSSELGRWKNEDFDRQKGKMKG